MDTQVNIKLQKKDMKLNLQNAQSSDRNVQTARYSRPPALLNGRCKNVLSVLAATGYGYGRQVGPLPATTITDICMHDEPYRRMGYAEGPKTNHVITIHRKINL